MDKNKSVFIYIYGNDEESTMDQLNRLKKYCDLKSYKVKKVYKDFISDYGMGRPELNSLLTDLKDNGINKVIISTTDILNDPSTFNKYLSTYNCEYETLDNFDMFSYLGKTTNSLFTLYEGRSY
ncbi:MAG: hypothetical protein E7159_04815 [Firmicutes bacterium]|nr:hypothetical protein [Bacillota bacterium]